MSDPLDEEWQHAAGALPQPVVNVVKAMRVDLSWLHAAWMNVRFSGGPGEAYSVVENREFDTTRELVTYRLWSVLGVLALVVGYPLFILGLATRFYARRLDRLSAGLGFAGVAGVSVVIWGVLSAATYLSSVAFEGFVAVVIAGVVATGSAVLALYFTQRDGRVSTVFIGYPFAVTALFLPPVVASLYSPTLAAVVFPQSTSLAIWLLDNVLAVGGLAAFIRASFELQGVAYVAMWFLLAVPTGWALGGLVTLTTHVRSVRAAQARQDPRDRLY